MPRPMLWAVSSCALAAIAIPALLLLPGEMAVPASEPIMASPAPVFLVSGTGAALARPLFSPTRLPEATGPANALSRPLATAAPAVVTPTPPPAPPTVTGIIHRVRGGGLALVRDASGKTVELHPGQQADGWTLARVGAASVTFHGERGAAEVGLDLTNKHKADAGGPSLIPAEPPMETQPR